MKKPSQNHPKAAAKFYQADNSIVASVGRLMVLSAVEFGTKGKNIDWGDVGSLASLAAQIASGVDDAHAWAAKSSPSMTLTGEEFEFVANTLSYVAKYSEDSAHHIDGEKAQFFIRSALIAAVIAGRK